MQTYEFRLRDKDSKSLQPIVHIRQMQGVPDEFDIEQFTGLYDTSNRQIFENDIVRVRKKVQVAVSKYADAYDKEVRENEWETVETVGIVKYIAPSFVVYYPKTSLRLNFSEPFGSNMNEVFVLGDIKDTVLFHHFK